MYEVVSDYGNSILPYMEKTPIDIKLSLSKKSDLKSPSKT